MVWLLQLAQLEQVVDLWSPLLCLVVTLGSLVVWAFVVVLCDPLNLKTELPRLEDQTSPAVLYPRSVVVVAVLERP